MYIDHHDLCPAPFNYDGSRCLMCNCLAEGVWSCRGNTIITVCNRCAVRWLPALIADATVGSWELDDLELFVLSALRKAWKHAVSLKAQRDIELESKRKWPLEQVP